MRRSTCVVCGTVTRSRKDRATCGDAECYSIHKSNVMQKVTKSGNGQHWTKELKPWPAGIMFDNIVEPDQGVFVPPPRPETHLYRQSSAAWATR